MNVNICFLLTQFLCGPFFNTGSRAVSRILKRGARGSKYSRISIISTSILQLYYFNSKIHYFFLSFKGYFILLEEKIIESDHFNYPRSQLVEIIEVLLLWYTGGSILQISRVWPTVKGKNEARRGGGVSPRPPL
jgi:hypothetical protein